MIFYEDFIKKLSETNLQIKEKEKFSIEMKKMISVMGVGLALLIIGLYQGYLAFLNQGNVAVRAIFGLVLLFLAIKQMRIVFLYRVVIDTENKILKSNNIVINLDEVETCTLKESKVGKNLETVVDIITREKKQFIIPFYMGKKLRFAFVLKELLKDRFIIKTK